ncbi:benzoate/H(+) symporter BenE family transporter [Luteimicrobium subarcticum]|uniref:Benzoate transporter/HAD superfamily hydrolase (TIGR01509 family) n=1 Tax=Luteimicrobium subarcticum TaxID=620910 RepID=A0A2M8W3U7_9MICO|nr:benzoate/H(+) symporter BenE family transporter [Luteimicrobium subarcticum]PJI85598.1 benzoate transporter/HAD superfamily hydrolase (TIGR01509 family) [Luteimicrobium subarcticum]
MSDDRRRAVVAGLVTALVGFSSTFAVVLAGLRTVGATREQAASGLLALCVAQGVGMVWLSRRHRMPVTLAWSTPGAALLAGATAVHGGWPAAVGAFAVTGLLLAASGLWPLLGALVARIPASVAQAMLAGVLLPLCVAPVHGLTVSPAVVAPVVVVWVVLTRCAPRWATPAALVLALGLVALSATTGWLAPPGHDVAAADLVPRLVWTTPTLTWQAVVGLAVPLFVVTTASQNVPGAAVMASFGYRVPWRGTLGWTGAATALGAPFGAHAVNLAAITAALAAGPDAGRDPARRWRAATTAGWAYLVLAVASGAVAALVAAAPAGLVESAAGLALLGTLGAALTGALRDERGRASAVVTFVVAASGVTVGGIGAAFWALAAGVVLHALWRPRTDAPRHDEDVSRTDHDPPRTADAPVPSAEDARCDTVLFDLGQVLVGWDPRGALAGAPGVSASELDAFLGGPFVDLNRRLDRAPTWDALRADVTRSAPEHVALMDWYVARFPAALRGPVPGTPELVAELRERGVRLVGLTNWSGDLFRHAVPAAPAIGLLEGVVVSGHEGVAKPDPAMFRVAVDRFGLVPARTVFVDDAAANVEAAAALGFRAVRFTGATDLRATLADLGLVEGAP